MNKVQTHFIATSHPSISYYLIPKLSHTSLIKCFIILQINPKLSFPPISTAQRLPREEGPVLALELVSHSLSCMETLAGLISLLNRNSLKVTDSVLFNHLSPMVPRTLYAFNSHWITEWRHQHFQVESVWSGSWKCVQFGINSIALLFAGWEAKGSGKESLGFLIFKSSRCILISLTTLFNFQHKKSKKIWNGKQYPHLVIEQPAMYLPSYWLQADI